MPEKLGLEKVILPVKNCRGIGKEDMMWNDKTPDIEIDPETYEVTLDGKIATVDPAKELLFSPEVLHGIEIRLRGIFKNNNNKASSFFFVFTKKYIYLSLFSCEEQLSEI